MLPTSKFIGCFLFIESIKLSLLQSYSKRNIRLYFNFYHVRKPTFGQFCNTILTNSHIKRQVYSLHLSNKDTSGQIRPFPSWFSLDEFSHLQSLTLTEVEQDDVEILKIILPLVPKLSSFSLIRSEVKSSAIDEFARAALRRIRKKLSHDLMLIEKIPSLTNLKLQHCFLEDVCLVLKNVPLLKYLNCQYVSSRCSLSNYLKESFDYPSVHLKQLVMTEFSCNFEEFEIFVQHTPNLKCLTITADNNKDLIDACRWEHLIASSLSQLAVFKFKFTCSDRYKMYNILDKFKQFQSDFWQNRHQWYSEYVLHTYPRYIDTDGDITLDDYSAQIYTIPYVSNVYIYK